MSWLFTTPLTAEDAASSASLPEAVADDGSRRTTRTQSAADSSHSHTHLEPPSRRTAQQIVRSQIVRSRTPSPRPSDDNVFTYDANMTSSVNRDDLREIVQACMEATSATQRRDTESLRRPDIPPFDQHHIEAWIRRMEAALERCRVTEARTKFAYMDKVFQASSDPDINAFLCGDLTADRWTEFIAHLREQHGRTTKDKVHSILNGVKREGRRPTKLAALIDEKAGDVTLDDIKKENLLKELPSSVQLQLADRVDQLDFIETAKLADTYFDKDGKLKHPGSTPPSISSVQPQQRTTKTSESPSFTEPFTQEDAGADVNAVRFRQGEKQHFNVSNRSSSASASRGRGSYSNGRGSNSSSRPSNSNSYGNSNSYNNNNNNNNNDNNASSAMPRKQVCHFHVNHGEKAVRCEPWCILNGKFSAQSSSGKAKAGQ